MPHFLVTIYRPSDYDPESEDEAMSGAIDRLNEAMVSAGVRRYVGGLQSPDQAASIHLGSDGDPEIVEGLYLKSSAYIGGLWILEVPTIEEALKWGRQAAIACRASVEVRPFHGTQDS